jgi:hypothetical protein
LTLGYYDLLGDYGTMHFGGQRPGCWINSIAAGGVLLMPEASTGCMCTFPNMGTVVFQPRQEQKAWAYYSTVGPLTPVKHLAVNFGAAGDRQDGSGLLWLAYPRPTGSLVLNFPVETSFYPGGSYVKQNSVYVSAQGTDSRWLFASAAAGLQKCSIPLLAPGDGRAQYRVRLAFLDSENELPGKRVFDIRLQGNLVAKEYDVVRAAQGKGRAVFAEYSGIGVDEKLIVEFGTKSGATSLASLPSLYGIEVTRERFIGLGFQIPDLVLNNARPQQTASLRLANLCDQPFRGTLQIAAPSGVSVTPQEQAVELTVGTRREIPVAFAVSPGTSPSRSDIPVKLVRSDGSLELARSIRVEHLGPRSRVAFPAVEDTCVVRRYGNRNFGTATMMQVDGGDQQMNDHLHTVALLKFRVHIPGKPVRATLRIVNAGNPAGDAGRICLVEQPWQETRVTYDNRPAAGRELAKLGRVQENEIVERTVPVGCLHEGEFSLMLDATSADGVDFLTRESGSPAELVVEYED